MKKPIQFGKYFLLDRINVGGMAEVFKAKAFGVEGFERLLAVKRILPNIAEDEEFITMFIDEAKIAVQLNHANICQIFDLGKVEDSYFIALEFVHGKDLRAIFDRCKQKPVDGATAMPIAQACFIVMKACEGLDYAHNKKDGQGREMALVHRDVSPQNILISYEGEVKLIDFGIAKAAGKMSKTQQGILKGKFGYMSPEQVRGLPLDRRSDVFSLGIVLYELLTGERLFIGESDFSTLEKVRNVEILPPSTYNRRISDELERIVMKALAKDVDDRYQNAIDLHDDLQAYMYSAGEFYSRKDLASWMKKVWAQEIEAETAKNEQWQKLSAANAPAAAAQGGAPVGERPRRNSIPPPPPPAATNAPPRISGQHPVVDASGNPAGAGPPQPVPQRPSGQHAVVQVPAAAATTMPGKQGTNGHHARPAGAEGELGWDDEELATNIYEPEDASQQVLDDKPDLSAVELSVDGSPVPARANTPTPTPAPAAARNGSASWPVNGQNGTSSSGPRPSDFVLPEPAPEPAFTRSGRAAPSPFDRESSYRPPERRKSKAPIYTVAGVAGAVLCATVVWLFVFLGNKPGEVVITSEPSVNVQVLVDNKRVDVDGTPATLKLEPGSYVVTVQREGYVPSTEQVEVKAGERVAKRFVLEALAATGFTLLSDPPGLQSLLDGKPLEGVTPLKVQSVSPGKHKIEVRGANGGGWTQEVQLEPGKIMDLKATVAEPGKPAKPAVASTEKAASPKASAPVEPKTPSAPAVDKPKPAATTARADKELPRLPKEESHPVAATKKPDKAPNLTLPDETDDETPAAKPQAKAKPAQASGGDGTLMLNSKPWTNIAIDGKDTGLHTPVLAMKLPAGSHRITLSNPQFNIKETFSVEVKAGETAKVIKDLRSQGQDSD